MVMPGVVSGGQALCGEREAVRYDVDAGDELVAGAEFVPGRQDDQAGVGDNWRRALAAAAFAFDASATAAGAVFALAADGARRGLRRCAAPAATIRTVISDPPWSPVKGATHYAAVGGCASGLVRRAC